MDTCDDTIMFKVHHDILKIASTDWRFYVDWTRHYPGEDPDRCLSILSPRVVGNWLWVYPGEFTLVFEDGLRFEFLWDGSGLASLDGKVDLASAVVEVEH